MAVTDSTLQDMERVLIELLLKGYLADEYNATAYMVNVYVRPGQMLSRLTRFNLQDVEGTTNGCPVIQVKLVDFQKSTRRSSVKTAGSAITHTPDRSGASLLATPIRSNVSTSKSASSKARLSAWKEDSDLDFEDDIGEDEEGPSERRPNASLSSNRMSPIEINSD